MGLLHHRKRKSSFISKIISLFHAQRSLIKALKVFTRIIFLRTRRDWKVSFITRAKLMSWFQRKLSHPFRAPYGAKHRACIFTLSIFTLITFTVISGACDFLLLKDVNEYTAVTDACKDALGTSVINPLVHIFRRKKRWFHKMEIFYQIYFI